MVKHGIVLHCDGPPWPKHDAQFSAHPLRRQERERESAPRCGRGRERERRREGSLRSGLLKIGGMSSRQFLSRFSTRPSRRRGPLKGGCESAALDGSYSLPRLDRERGKMIFTRVAKNLKKSSDFFFLFYPRKKKGRNLFS